MSGAFAETENNPVMTATHISSVITDVRQSIIFFMPISPLFHILPA